MRIGAHSTILPGTKIGSGASIGAGSVVLDSVPNNSIFAGIEYFTPIEDLSIKLEYDTTDYSMAEGREMKFDEFGDLFELKSRFNYGLNYRIDLSSRDKLDLSLGYVRGNILYAGLEVHSNLNIGNPKTFIGSEKIRNTNLPGGESFFTLDDNVAENK